MRLLRAPEPNYDGLELEVKAPSALTGVYAPASSSWFGMIQESFTGAWQRNIQCETLTNIVAYLSHCESSRLWPSSNSRRTVNGPTRWVTRMPKRGTVIVRSFFHETL